MRLWVEAESADDLDIYVFIQKLGADGTILLSESLPGVHVPVATGQLRASHRELDEARSTPLEPHLLLPAATDSVEPQNARGRRQINRHSPLQL